MTKSKHELKITNQFRSGSGIVFGFRYNKNNLTLSISPRQTLDDSEGWCVEARTNQGQDAAIVREWGVTRADALREVGRAWDLQALSNSLPSFDWEAVATALSAVRAL